MDPTPRPRPLALRTGLHHLRRIAIGGGAALGLLGIAAGGPVHAWPPAHGAGAVSTQRAVHEDAGQHRLAGAGDPSQWGLTSKDPELPVTST